MELSIVFLKIIENLLSKLKIYVFFLVDLAYEFIFLYNFIEIKKIGDIHG